MSGLAPDILAVNETWLRPGEEDRAPKVVGYRLKHCPRPVHIRGGRGGGVGFYIQRGINARLCDYPPSSEVEQMWLKVRTCGVDVLVGTAYRPPWQDVDTFLDAIADSIASFTTYDSLVLAGDFNINLLDTTCGKAKVFSQFINSVGLSQVITEPTHYTEHSRSLIDVICTDTHVLKKVIKHTPDLGGHAMISVTLKVRCEKPSPQWVTFRPLKSIIVERLNQDLDRIDWSYFHNIDNMDILVDTLSSCFTSLFDLHAPVATRKFKSPPHPWITDSIKSMMHIRDGYHAKWKRQGTESLRDCYKSMKQLVVKAIEREKCCYFNGHINRNINNSKKLWQNLKANIIPTNNKNIELPPNSDPNAINVNFLNIPGEGRVTMSLLTYFEHHR